VPRPLSADKIVHKSGNWGATDRRQNAPNPILNFKKSAGNIPVPHPPEALIPDHRGRKGKEMKREKRGYLSEIGLGYYKQL